MIHYHGGPITPDPVAAATWKARHAFVSFAHPSQVSIAAEVSQSFALDNGAFSVWKAGKTMNWEKYYQWVSNWVKHPRFDFAVIPDSIEGDVAENDKLLDEWPIDDVHGCPVYHMHEPVGRAERLSKTYYRIAIGSSGEYSVVGNSTWRSRMEEIMLAVTDTQGYPNCKIHGLRMLNPKVYVDYPFASADSTNIARNVGIDKKWKGTYTPGTKTMRALVMADRIESNVSAGKWLPKCLQ